MLLFMLLNLTASDGHTFSVQQVLAPVGGDLVREGKQPVVILAHQKGEGAAMKPLVAPLRQAGFSLLIFPLRPGSSQARADLAAVRSHLAKIKVLDPQRVYGLAAGTEGLILAAEGTAKDGLVWLTPVLEGGAWKATQSIGNWKQRPLVLVADLQDRFPVTTLKAMLGSRYKKPVKKVIRSGLGKGLEMLTRKASMADQVTLMLQTWAGKNCDKVNKRKRSVTETGCKADR